MKPFFITFLAVLLSTFAYPNEAEERLKQLQAQRVEVLERVVEHHKIHFQEGVIPLTELLEPQVELTNAKLSYEKDKERRINILKTAIKQTSAIEKICRARYEAGASRESDLLKATAMRLKFEILLVKEETK